jgi:hypothetical protein
VRLSPKPVFLGLVALGLPFAVTVGWQLAGPQRPPAPISAPPGAGGIGAAPTHAAVSGPVTAVDWSSAAPKSVAATSAGPGAPPPSVAVPRPVPPSARTATRQTLPALTLPPVPTPIEITSPPPSPSATPPSSAAPEPSGLDAARLMRRP